MFGNDKFDASPAATKRQGSHTVADARPGGQGSGVDANASHLQCKPSGAALNSTRSDRRCFGSIGGLGAALLLCGCAGLPLGSMPELSPEAAKPARTGPGASDAAAETVHAQPALAPDAAVAAAVVAGSKPIAAQGAVVAETPDTQASAATTATTTTAATAVSRMRLDPEQDSARLDLWKRVRAGFAINDLEGDLVGQWERYYATRPEYVHRMMERGGRYLFHIMEEVDRRGMPTELALLPFIESAFNPQAKSSAAASGIWQFMPLTGKDFDLRQNLFRDDRRHVLASTQAALDYLQRLHRMFGDWHLALAAYNWGQGNVQRAVRANERRGAPSTYTALKMPDETRNYVPKLQAIKNIVSDPQRLGLSLPPLENHPYFLTVDIERDIDVEAAARLSGLSLEEFQQLNPQMNKPVILAAGTPQVLLPYDNANRFVRALHDGGVPLASWTAWVAPRTLRVAEAARLTGFDEARLREVNRIPPNMLVRAGSTLLVPRHPGSLANVAEHVADNARISLAPGGRPLRKVVVQAGKGGDSVQSVARRYKVSAKQVAEWNDVSSSASFKAGARVVLMLPAKSATSAKRASRPATAQSPKAKGKSTARSASSGKATRPSAAKGGAPARAQAARP